MHKSLDEFEFLPDPTTSYKVSCSCTSKNDVAYFTLFPSLHLSNRFSLGNMLAHFASLTSQVG